MRSFSSKSLISLKEKLKESFKEHITSICCVMTASLHPVAFFFLLSKGNSSWCNIWLLHSPKQQRYNVHWKKKLLLSFPTEQQNMRLFLSLSSYSVMEWQPKWSAPNVEIIVCFWFKQSSKGFCSGSVSAMNKTVL